MACDDPTGIVTPCDHERFRNEGRQRNKVKTPTECDEWLERHGTPLTPEQEAAISDKRMRPVKPGPKSPRQRPVKPTKE